MTKVGSARVLRPFGKLRTQDERGKDANFPTPAQPELVEGRASTMPQDIPPRRIMAIWLTQLAVDRWRRLEACPERSRRGCAKGEGADAEPVALIAETAHGPRIEASNDAG